MKWISVEEEILFVAIVSFIRPTWSRLAVVYLWLCSCTKLDTSFEHVFEIKRKGFIAVWAETCRINGYFPDLRHCCILYQYPVRRKMRAKRAKTASTIHFMKNQMWFFALSVFTCIGDNVVHCKIACLNGNHKTNEHVEEKSKPNCLQPKLITYCLVCEVKKILPEK